MSAVSVSEKWSNYVLMANYSRQLYQGLGGTLFIHSIVASKKGVGKQAVSHSNSRSYCLRVIVIDAHCRPDIS